MRPNHHQQSVVDVVQCGVQRTGVSAGSTGVNVSHRHAGIASPAVPHRLDHRRLDQWRLDYRGLTNPGSTIVT